MKQKVRHGPSRAERVMLTSKAGFTLIELSIVLVIIGLIIGAVLAGQDLIRSAKVRATISQVEKFNAAVNTFYGKYGYLPGDIPDPGASFFGFTPRGQYAGEGDGNGMLNGVTCNNVYCNNPHASSAGENITFWVDLSTAHLIDATFTSGSPFVLPSSPITGTTNPSLTSYLPVAKLGQNNYFYAWSDIGSGNDYLQRISTNFFGMSAVTQIPTSGDLVSSPNLPVQQAYAIDLKIDDGFPKTGNVIAVYLTTGGGSLPAGGGLFGANLNNATPGSSTTCYDNNNVAGAQQTYSIEISKGSNLNCALSFQFQ